MSAQETTNDPDRAARIAELSPDKRALLGRRLARATGLATQTPVAPAPRPLQLALSFAQQRLWFLEQWQGGGGALYNVAKGWWLSGDVDVERLRNAFAQLVTRHDALRTEFLSDKGQPLQRVVAQVAVELPLIDLRGLAEVSGEHARARALELAQEQARLAFTLEHAPLLRLVLIRMAPSAHLLVLVMHHIVSDGWSMGVFYRELCALYAGRGAQLPALPVQYPDYALWQRAQLQGAALERELAYWRQQLTGLTVLELPCDRPRPPVQSHGGARQALALSADLTSALKHLSQSERVTLYMVLLAAFQVLLARISGQDDIALGSPIAGRSRGEFEGLIGFFVNTLVFRIDMAGDPTFRELLAQVREVALDAYAHQDLPFEKLVEELNPERDPSRSPLIQVMFVLQNAPGGELTLPGLQVSAQDLDTGTAKFDLTLALAERPDGLHGHLEYATDLYDADRIERLAGHFITLLQGIVEHPGARVSELPLLSHAERHQILVEWNNTATDFPRNATIPQLFEAQVERTPEAVAVVFEDKQLSYRQLNQRANHVATFLRGLGVKPDTLVAIHAERSLEMVVGLLGILKAGGAYVPLDPSYPKERLAFMLEDTQAPAILTQRRLVADMPPSRATMLCLDKINWEANPGSQDNAATGITADNLAYVIYTSGSTGKPKGVMVTHRAICNHLFWMQRVFPLTAEDRVLQKTEISFDASIWEFYAPLIAGARMVMARPQGHRDSTHLVKAIAEYRVTVLQVVPAMMQFILQEPALHGCTSLRNIFCGGDVLSPEVVAQGHQRLDANIINLYGPTEAAIDTLFWVCQRGYEGRSVPIGRPIDNAQVYILDSQLHPVPVGVPGELYVGGAGLARGYLNRPELTAERFVADPFSAEPARMYRTGDLVRYLSDGNIEFLGRLDHQIKLRGFRIELGEIEAALTRHAQVREALVLLREDVPGDKRLVAYVVARQAGLDTSELRAQLKQQLPEYMLPAAFVVLPALPLTPNGKIDRNRLPAPQQEHSEAQAGYIAPGNTVEAQLVQIWEEVLGIKPVGIHDNFFDLGGHSLLATQVLFRARDSLQINLSLRALFECPTVCELAAYIGAIVWATNPDTHISGDEREVGAI